MKPDLQPSTIRSITELASLAEQTGRFFALAFRGRTTGNVTVHAHGESFTTSYATVDGANVRNLLPAINFIGDSPADVDLLTSDECVGMGIDLQDDEAPPISPTLVMVNEDGRRHAVWLLQEASDRTALDALASYLGVETIFRVPVPGLGGWSLHETSGLRCGVDDLLRVFPQAKINDALIYGTLDPALLSRAISISVSKMGAKTIPGRWKPSNTTVGDLLVKLAIHGVGEKDGPALLQGAVIGGDRKAQAVESLDLLILDVDSGEEITDVRRKVQNLGLLCLLHTTHSHLSTMTEVDKDAVLRHMPVKREPTAVDVCNYLQEVKRVKSTVLEGAELVGTPHTKDGIKLVLNHRPWPKLRAVFVLNEPFVIAKRAISPQDARNEWSDRHRGAARLLGVVADRSTVDPSRLFFLPRHPADAKDYEVEIVAGRALDINEVQRISANDLRLEAMNAFERAAHEAEKDGQYKTTSLRWFFAKYGDRFEVDDFFLESDPDGDRGPRSAGPGRVHRCPNDNQHSNAGDDKDAAFMCVNASESDTGKAIALCRHDACANLDRIDFTDMICQRAGISDATELKKWVPEVEGEEDEEEEAEGPRGAASTFLKNGEEAEQDIPPTKPRKAVEWMNARFACARFQKDYVVMDLRDEAKVVPLSIPSMKAEFANRFISVGDGRKPLFNFWFTSQLRRQYRGVVFKPGADAGPKFLNLWGGWAVEGKSGDWSKLREHIFSNVCQRNAVHFVWLMCWLAQIVQEPQLKPGTAVVLRGLKGTGKSKLAEWVSALMPFNATPVASPEELFGKFNAGMAQMLFVSVEEGFWAGSQTAEGQFKHMITSPNTKTW